MLGVLQRSLAIRFPGLLKFASKLPVRRAIAMKACFSIIEKELGDIFDATAYHHDDHAKDFISSILKANSKTVKAKDRLSEVETKGQGKRLLKPWCSLHTRQADILVPSCSRHSCDCRA